MKVLSPKMILGTVATVGMVALGINYCNRDSYLTKQANEILKEAKDDYKRDSLNFINSDSILANEKLAKLEELKKEYIEKNKPANISTSEAELFALITGDEKIKEMDKNIYNARLEVDIATGNVFKRSKERLAKAEENLKIRKLIDKMIRKDELSKEEQEFVQKEHQKIIEHINHERIIGSPRVCLNI